MSDTESNKLDLSSLKDKISSKLNAQKEKKSNDKKTAKKNEVDDVLRREALSLGATEKDLELLEGEIDNDLSEQEFNASDEDSKEDEAFTDDLKSFMKNIGLENRTVDDIETKSEPEDEGVEEAELSPSSAEDEEEEEEEEQQEDAGELQPESEQEAEDVENHNTKGLVTQTNISTAEKLIISFETAWYQVPLDPQIEQNIKEDTKLTKEQIETLLERGKQALEIDNQTYFEGFTRESSQKKFMSQILSDGTLSDKISALTLLIQESPIHNTKSLETLLSYCNKKSRNSQLQSLNALKDLLLNGMLPDRKLRYFKNQPGLSMMLNKRTLAIFYFEDYLKKTFFKILEILEKLSHDPIIHVRSKILSHIFDLLTSKPEQEFNLLRLGVNKLGDIDSKVSSKASYLLLQLQQMHPNMKSIVIDNMVDLALRPNADYHTVYYSVITLNQTILKRSEDSIANKLIKTYFTLFEKFLVTTDKQDTEIPVKSNAKGYENKRKKNFKRGKNGGKSVKNEKTDAEILSEKNSKLFSALLTGINRSFPFATIPASIYEAHMETLYKITHSSNFNTSIQALILINQVTVKACLNTDRYYKTLYESLFDPRLLNSSKQGIYFNLLYKSLKQDAKNVARVEAFVKRILQVSSHWLNVGTIAGFFYLLIQLVQTIPQIRNLLINSPVDYQYQSDSQGEEDEKKEKKIPKQYDSRKRDPKFANADQSSLWEITQFVNHFHPTVQSYADAFINNKPNEVTKPDLGLFTLAHFLDRFVYRNARQKQVTRGSSIMQPLFGGSQLNSSLLVKASDMVNKEAAVNTTNWLDKKVSEIKPDEKFFYQYFVNKKSAIKQKQQNEKKEIDSDNEGMDEDEIWDALVKSRPDVEHDSGDELEFSGEDFSDMSDSEDEEAFEEEEEDDIEIDEAIFNDDESSDQEEEAEEDSKKRKNVEGEASEEGSKKNKRQKKESLPLFADAADYAKYLESDSD
ncbi:hypothetical protein KAFR_0C00260 [Kazachstania africana CBS 2517]|uniref:CCAAT-binding factor domain-containing protein n=1 Tax=Kazachstania africana (strain ATCC 22294 / BCRC 22015 / CBS 2517 / CECT 1963 / NBRC 1671 / NRRL Y-8276) TaxID=1071382 RepID=H2ARM2_KAZAF|nr:hypothetical protein KAFR_0C00260 [Kazachstania africana CBS 2517]CCF57022.1 hypothetical protein KAFR_0C00260 [Kazachstania africana CBS 2517]